MKSIILCILVFVLLVPFCIYSQEDFWTTPIGKEIVNLGLRFLDNPGDFIFNLHSDNVDFTPVLKNSRLGTIRTNFYPTILPGGFWLNFTAKVKVLTDGKYKPWLPQIDILSEYGRMLAIDIFAKAASDESAIAPVLHDYAAGFMLTKSLQEDIRLYAGLYYSNATVNFKLDKPVEFGAGAAFSLRELNVTVADYIIITGLENKIKENRYAIVHIGYGIKTNKIVARIGWYYKHMEWGFNIYPEGLFVVHPFLSWHWYF